MSMDFDDWVMLGFFLLCSFSIVSFVVLGFIDANRYNDGLRLQRIEFSRSSDCSVNGVPVNCSEFYEEYPDWSGHGYHTIGGVCPGWNDNRTVEECLEEARR